MRRLVAFTALVLVVLSAGCGSADAEPTLPNSWESPGQLAVAVLDALERGDREALQAMRVTRDEYEAFLWDQLPESTDLPIDYVWMLNDRNSNAALSEALDDMTGTKFQLLDLTFSRPSEEYDGFTVHLGARMLVRRVEDDARGEIPLVDVLVEKGGRWKLLNFSD